MIERPRSRRQSKIDWMPQVNKPKSWAKPKQRSKTNMRITKQDSGDFTRSRNRRDKKLSKRSKRLMWPK